MKFHSRRLGLVFLAFSTSTSLVARGVQRPDEERRLPSKICQAPDDGEPPAPVNLFILPANPLRNSGQTTAIPKSSVVVKGTAEAKSKRPNEPQPSPPPSTRIPALVDVPQDKEEMTSANSDDVELDDQDVVQTPEVDSPKSKATTVTKKRVRDLQEEPDLKEGNAISEEVSGKDVDRDQEKIHREMEKNLPSSIRLSDKKPSDVTNRRSPVLNVQQKQLKQRLETCIAYYLFRPESIIKRSPWAVMHAMLPFGVEAEVATNRGNVNAIGWMCFNGKCRTQKIFIPKDQSFSMAVGPGVQGHEGQFLAMLAQSGVPSTYPIQVGEYRGTVQDVIQYEMASCKVKTELTFKLIALSHYLASDHTWRTSDGVEWSIAKLVEEELAQPVNGAACGGTHRLMGLTYCVQRRREQGLPIDGSFARAEEFTEDFRRYAWTLQNPDGSFSTKWFEGRAADPDMEKKVQTTGHILEWLIYATPQEELTDPRIVRALNFLTANLYDKKDHDWPIGPRGHALRAMNLYDMRFFGATPGKQRQQLASIRRVPSNRR